MSEYVENKDSYIRRALGDLKTELEILQMEGEYSTNLKKAIGHLEQALKITTPYSSPDSSADASKPDTE